MKTEHQATVIVDWSSLAESYHKTYLKGFPNGWQKLSTKSLKEIGITRPERVLQKGDVVRDPGGDLYIVYYQDNDVVYVENRISSYIRKQLTYVGKLVTDE